MKIYTNDFIQKKGVKCGNKKYCANHYKNIEVTRKIFFLPQTFQHKIMWLFRNVAFTAVLFLILSRQLSSLGN